jgi:hypothetical protein
MWLESLYNPGSVIKYEGVGYRQDIGTTVFQTAKMVSHVVDYANLITAVFVT